LLTRFWKKNFLFLGPPLILFSLAGCFYNLNLDRSSPLEVNLMDYQPTAFLPVPEASGFPESAAKLNGFIRARLAAKGFSLRNPEEVSLALEEIGLIPHTSQKLLAQPVSLRKLGERLKVRLIFAGTLLDYHLQKSYVRSTAFQVWDGTMYDYRSLPTYHQGAGQIRLKLMLFAPEKGSVVWMAEGTVRGPSSSADALGEKLVNRLLADLPTLIPSSKD
jgi:hypothetical protein